MDELDKLLGLSEDDVAAIEWRRNTPRDCCHRLRGEQPEERTCTEGNCIEDWCPCGAFLGSGQGPVGCPCQDKPPWTPAVPTPVNTEEKP